MAVPSNTNGAARAQSDYGVNRVAAASFAPVDDESLRQTSIGGPFADAFSVWADRFVVQGGSGVGSLSVSAIVSCSGRRMTQRLRAIAQALLLLYC